MMLTSRLGLRVADVYVIDITDRIDLDANAGAITNLQSTVTQQGKDITAQAKRLDDLKANVDGYDARITNQDETIAQNGLAMANGFRQLQSSIGDNSAAIITTSKTVTDLEKSTTEQMTTLKSQVGDMSSTVQQTASTVADLNGKLGAQWGVKVNTSSGGKNYVAGIQLGIDGSGQSQFLVQADQFGIYVPNGDKSNLAFGVDGNGAYMQQAMARNLVIDFAQISNNIQSTNYVEGVSGWAINKNGGAQFNNAIFRGHVEASSGSFQGNINATSGSFRGTIDATDGIFRGTVQASRFIGDICSAGVFPEGKRPDITHYDSGNNGVPKTYAVSAVVACGVSFVGKIRVWIKGIKVSEIGVSGASDNASTRYIPVFGALSGVTDTNVRCEVTIEGSGIANYNGGFVIMTRSTGSWA